MLQLFNKSQLVLESYLQTHFWLPDLAYQTNIKACIRACLVLFCPLKTESHCANGPGVMVYPCDKIISIGCFSPNLKKKVPSAGLVSDFISFVVEAWLGWSQLKMWSRRCHFKASSPTGPPIDAEPGGPEGWAGGEQKEKSSDVRL